MEELRDEPVLARIQAASTLRRVKLQDQIALHIGVTPVMSLGRHRDSAATRTVSAKTACSCTDADITAGRRRSSLSTCARPLPP